MGTALTTFEDFEFLQFDQDSDQESLWEFIDIFDNDTDSFSSPDHRSDFLIISLVTDPTRARRRQTHLVRLLDLPFQTPLDFEDRCGLGDDDVSGDKEEDDGYRLDDELVPWSVSEKFVRERMRKLAKRIFAKMQNSKRSPYLVGVLTSFHSPPSGADDGTPPPERTPEASPITFSPRRIRRIPIFRRDQSFVKFWVEVAAQTFKLILSGGENDRDPAGIRSGGGVPLSEPSERERRNVCTLSLVRMSSFNPDCIYIEARSEADVHKTPKVRIHQRCQSSNLIRLWQWCLSHPDPVSVVSKHLTPNSRLEREK
ncbi:hypothetical protein ACLB2K_026013 [Fragaria x ananassa]